MKFSDGVALINHPALHTVILSMWADLGCGTGFFTDILSYLLPKQSVIYAMDSDEAAIRKVKVADGIALTTFALDFVKDELPFEKADGILMANALHYVKDKAAFVQKLRRHLTVKGILLLVEYDMNIPNPWVPYPLSFAVLTQLCRQNSFASVEKINAIASAFGRADLYGAIIKM
ncbi:MAG TPA: class I SAM-dependent methyltransferase [Chitinophagaceae bacterium]|nr:class I SAM-dependent methyltransferase [Chitinophagaceae bacterium]